MEAGWEGTGIYIRVKQNKTKSTRDLFTGKKHY